MILHSTKLENVWRIRQSRIVVLAGILTCVISFESCHFCAMIGRNEIRHLVRNLRATFMHVHVRQRSSVCHEWYIVESLCLYLHFHHRIVLYLTYYIHIYIYIYIYIYNVNIYYLYGCTCTVCACSSTQQKQIQCMLEQSMQNKITIRHTYKHLHKHEHISHFLPLVLAGYQCRQLAFVVLPLVFSSLPPVSSFAPPDVVAGFHLLFGSLLLMSGVA